MANTDRKLIMADLLKYVAGKNGSFVYDEELGEAFNIHPIYANMPITDGIQPIDPVRNGLIHLAERGLVQIADDQYVIEKGQRGRKLEITDKGRKALEAFEKARAVYTEVFPESPEGLVALARAL